MNWKGFGSTWFWHNRGTFLETTEKPFSQDCQSPDQNTDRVPSKSFSEECKNGDNVKSNVIFILSFFSSPPFPTFPSPYFSAILPLSPFMYFIPHLISILPLKFLFFSSTFKEPG
jgi:hypothetical protein